MDWRFWRWRQRDNDLNDEIAHDLAADAEERVRSGIPREEAELASRRDFGNVSLAQRRRSRDLDLGLGPEALAGRSLWLAHAALKPAIHVHGRSLAGPGNRREHSHL